MKSLSFFSPTIWALVFLVGWRYEAPAASIDELVAASRKEGVLNLHSPSALTPEGARELGAAFNKKYGLNIKVNYFASKGFANDVATIITQTATGAAPDWDVMVLTEDLHTVLSLRRLHLPFDYKGLGIDPKAIDHDSGSVAFTHVIILPSYNTKIVAAKDMPRSWEDFLDPKWKDGKLGIFDARYFALLAAGSWGEKKTTEYVRGLARQRPFLGRLAEVYTRLELGEVLVAPIFPDMFIQRAKRTGAPIVFADKVEPALILAQNIAVLKGAAHPHVGHLFANFTVSTEAQAILEKYLGSSILIPGTAANNFVKNRGESLLLRARDPNYLEKWSDEYNRILGFKR